MKKKKVALVLSGGAVLGFAHIGVLKVLEKYGIDVDIVVGTSMGGLVAAAYSVGLSIEEMTEFACKFKGINFVDINFDSSGFFSGRGMMRSINKFVPDKKIEDLDKKFACVACDILTEEEYIFSSGSIRDAVRATVSIPGFLTPHKVGKHLLVDGGVVNNLPDSVAKDMGADIIISCDVLSKCRLEETPSNLVVAVMAGMNCLTKVAQKYRPKYSDILLEPDLKGVGQMNFNKKSVLKAIEMGEKEMETNIDKILALL